MVNKLAKHIKTKAVNASIQYFFVPSILRTIEATDLADVEAIVAKDKTNQEIEVGDGNS
ncbi:hypothetical protein [Arthrobacter sp. AL12]|uniref:hypothetical protein n=1 Tax=Arthrobacter sp. AL12 TaxID=3042241 RepID=UPI00249B942A|nr:hypothetical protein [Arthrobacter sp. AL12]MDI3211763.1 hypothetical protein [Arthrobacter sp. AL12]